MNLLNYKEFPEETKTNEFVFENGVANNRLRTHFNSNNSLYLLFENYGNPNYIDVTSFFIRILMKILL